MPLLLALPQQVIQSSISIFPIAFRLIIAALHPLHPSHPSIRLSECDCLPTDSPTGEPGIIKYGVHFI